MSNASSTRVLFILPALMIAASCGGGSGQEADDGGPEEDAPEADVADVDGEGIDVPPEGGDEMDGVTDPVEDLDADIDTGCTGDEECPDDGDRCNGEEYCETASGTCGHRNPPAEGTECEIEPGTREICLAGACVESLCGDAFVDEGGGEFCEPDLDPTCRDDCTFACTVPDDCPDDGNMCNGEEYCDESARSCDRRNIPADGTECVPALPMICLGGLCQASVCGDGFVDTGFNMEQCDDGNGVDGDGCDGDCTYSCEAWSQAADCGDGLDCTGDVCDEATHTCSHPVLASGTLCRPAAGPCDLDELCSGTDGACPADAFRPGTYQCRAAADAYCDVAENCTGSSADCPADAFRSEGTACSDYNSCTAPDLCDGAGTCIGGSVIVPSVPAPLAPENGALTGSVLAPASFNALRPLFRWSWTPDACPDRTFEIQVDNSCATPGFASCGFPSPEAAATGLSGTSWRPASNLSVSLTRPVGARYYWRVRACRGSVCSAWSPVRYVDVGRVANDFDCDGHADALIGAFMQANGANFEGNAFVYEGSATGVVTNPSRTLDNPANQASGHFGQSVASAGDVNADGYADAIVGAPDQDNGATNEGNAFLYLGSATGLPASPSFTLDNPANQADGRFGVSVASAGDVNGDGYADVIVGADYQDSGAANEGNAFVYHGSASGISATPSRTLDNPANQADGRFGHSVASAGDVNGDGFADVIVGADYQDSGATNEGNAFIYHGSAAGIPATPSRTLDNPDNESNGNFGNAVASAGDANADGYADVIVGANLQDNGSTDEGNAFVYLGSATGIPSAFSTRLDNPLSQADSLFGFSVASAGDVNGDGYDDVIVGALLMNGIGVDEGYVFIYHGHGGGISATPNLNINNPTDQANAQFGVSVASAADLNADGYEDVIVGAWRQDFWEGDEGNAFLYMGTSTGLPATSDRTIDNPADQNGGGFGISVASAWDVMEGIFTDGAACGPEALVCC